MATLKLHVWNYMHPQLFSIPLIKASPFVILHGFLAHYVVACIVIKVNQSVVSFRLVASFNLVAKYLKVQYNSNSSDKVKSGYF